MSNPFDKIGSAFSSAADSVGSAFGRAGDSVKDGISQVVEPAQQWMTEKADFVRDSINEGYSEMVNTAVGKLTENSPDWLKEPVTAIGSGFGTIGGKVLEFLDPVSYALDTGADLLDMSTNSIVRRFDAIDKIAQGDVGEGLSDFGKELLDQELLGAQIGVALLPGGHVAGKAAKKPIKAARKGLKKELKATEKHTIERKAVKHDLHVNKLKSHVGVKGAKASGITAKHQAKQGINDARSRLNIQKRTLHAPTRDWDTLLENTGRDTRQFGEDFTHEEVTEWTRKKQKRK